MNFDTNNDIFNNSNDNKDSAARVADWDTVRSILEKIIEAVSLSLYIYIYIYIYKYYYFVIISFIIYIYIYT